MGNIVSASLSESDEKFRQLKPIYDEFVSETKKRRIRCMESILVTTRYEVVPSSDPALAEEGIGTVVQKMNKMYKFDVYTLDSKTSSYPDRLINKQNVAVDVFDVRNDSEHSLIDEYEKAEINSTTFNFKIKSYGFFDNNKTSAAYIGIMLKSDQSIFDINNGIGLVIGRAESNVPTIKFTGWNKGKTGSFLSGTETPFTLIDNKEYQIELQITKSGATRKFIYTINGDGKEYSSGLVTETFTNVDYTFNDILMFVANKQVNANPWSFTVYDVDIKRE